MYELTAVEWGRLLERAVFIVEGRDYLDDWCLFVLWRCVPAPGLPLAAGGGDGGDSGEVGDDADDAEAEEENEERLAAIADAHKAK